VFNRIRQGFALLKNSMPAHASEGGLGVCAEELAGCCVLKVWKIESGLSY